MKDCIRTRVFTQSKQSKEMSASEAMSAPKKVAGAKKATAKKTHVAPEHPKYSEMIKQALSALKERGGSSRQAVLKYIMANFNVGKDESAVNSHLKMALRAGVKNSSLKQSKGMYVDADFMGLFQQEDDRKEGTKESQAS